MDQPRRPAHSPLATDPALVDDARGAADAPSTLGCPETPGRRGAPRAGGDVAEPIDGVRPAQGARVGRAAAPAEPPGPRDRRRWRPITAVNQTWTTDFKGHFRTGDGGYCYPLTLRDGFSRFVLRCDALGRPDLRGHPPALRTRVRRVWIARSASAVITAARLRAPASPACRGCRSGGCAWGSSRSGLPLGHPEQNGSHEQFHSVLKADTARPPAAHARAQQHRFNRFCAEYNDERPHEALQDAVPASCYQPVAAPAPTAAARRSSIPGILKIRRVSTIGQVVVARHTCCFSAERSPTPTLPLKKSTMASGRSTLPPSSLGSLRRPSPPHSTDRTAHGGALAGCAGSRLTSRKNNDQKP